MKTGRKRPVFFLLHPAGGEEQRPGRESLNGEPELAGGITLSPKVFVCQAPQRVPAWLNSLRGAMPSPRWRTPSMGFNSRLYGGSITM